MAGDCRRGLQLSRGQGQWRCQWEAEAVGHESQTEGSGLRMKRERETVFVALNIKKREVEGSAASWHQDKHDATPKTQEPTFLYLLRMLTRDRSMRILRPILVASQVPLRRRNTPSGTKTSRNQTQSATMEPDKGILVDFQRIGRLSGSLAKSGSCMLS